MEGYLGSRWINEPLRVFDCAFEVDAAVAIVLAADDVAEALTETPVWLVGSTASQSRGRWDGWEDLTAMYSTVAGPRLWEKTRRRPADVDVACMYDCFSYTVMATMEGFGFCDVGQVGTYFADGRATYGGDVVVNPHGGLLSEGYVHGLNHYFEAVLQLRDDAGPRQVREATVALVTSGMGPFGGANLFSSERP
jgi:acetyl-CoA acetyltransferase